MPKIARFQLPDGKVARFEVPDEATPEQAQAMMSSYFAGSQTQPQQPQQPQQKEYAGFGGSFMDSATQLGLADEAAVFMANPTKENRDKLLAAGESKYKTVGFGEGNNWEAFKELVGGTLGSITAPILAGIPTGGIGAGTTAYTQYAIGAAQRAAERQRAQEEAGQAVEDISQTKILGAAAGETALDYLGLKFFKGIGSKLPGKLGDQIAKLDPDKGMKAIEESIKNGTYSLKGNMLRGVGKGLVVEVPQEVAQQMLERYGAGLDLTSPDAMKEYGQAALGAGILGGPLGAVSRGLDIRTARKNIEKAAAPTKATPPKYMSQVESLVKDGFSVKDAEEIVTTAEGMKDFTANPEEALAMARKQWERENERPPVEAVSTGEGGKPESAGVGTGVPVPSPQGGGEGVAGKPAEAGAVGLVPPDTGAKPAGGGEGGIEPALAEAPVPTPKAPEIVAPEVTQPETIQEEFDFEQPETTIEPAKAEEAKVEEPAVEPTKVEEAKPEEPAKVEEPSAEPIAEPVTAPAAEPTGITEEAVAAAKEPIIGYDQAVEAVNKQAAFPERIITPAYIAKETGLSIPEAKALLEKLAADGVVGAKRGVSGYEQVKGEEEVAAAPATEAPAALPEAPVVDAAARRTALREKIEQAFEDDVITEDQYRESMLALQKGAGLSRKVLQLIGDKEAAPKAETTQAPAQPVTEKKAQRDLTDEEFNAAHMALNDGEDLPPALLDILGVDPRTLPTTRVDQNTGKVNITGMSPRESINLLRDRLEEARKTLGLSDSAYRTIARDINAGRDLSTGTLDLLGVTQGLSPAEGRAKYLREVLNKKRREQQAAKLAEEEGIVTGDTPEAKIEQLAAAKARYTTTVLQMSAKLLETNKISPYEHAALVNEATKEEPNREAIAKLLAAFKKRTKSQEPVRLPIDEKDAAELIIKRLDAKASEKAGPRVMAAKARPKVIEGKADNVEAAVAEYLVDNTPDEITGKVFGESDHHPEWATNVLKDMPEATIIYSDGDVAIYRGNVNGAMDYGVIERNHPIEGLSIQDYVRTLNKNDPRYLSIFYAMAEHNHLEELNIESTPEGPFQGKKGQVVISENMDKRYGDLLSSLMKNLNLEGLRIFLYHPKDIQGTNRHLYGLYGTRYGTIDSIPIEEGTLGHKVDIGEKIPGTMQGKDFAIMLRPGMSERLTVEVLTHELGHVIEDVAYQTASPEVKAAIKADYDKWYKESREKSPFDVLSSLKLSEERTANLSARDYVPGEIVGTPDYDAYLRSFPEWWADNVARWMNTSAKPVSIIDKFFSGVAAQLRKLIQAVTGRPLPPSKAVASFLEDMQMGRRNYVADFLGQKIPTDFDMSSIFSTGYEASKVPPRVMKAATRAKDANQQIAEAEEKYRNSNNATNQVNAVGQAIKDRDAAKFGEAVDIYIDGLGSGARDTALSTLTSSWLTERVEKILPSLRQASDLMDLIAGSRDRMQRAFSKMSKELSDYVTANGQVALGRVIHFARLLQVSAAKWDESTTLAQAIDSDDEVKAYRDKAAAATTVDVRDKFLAKAKERETIIAKVFSEWTALGQQEGGQAMYKKVMNFYRNAHTVVHSLLNKDIDNMPGLTPEQKAALKKEADETFSIAAKGEVDEDGIFRRTTVESYFPWRRFGQYWLRVNKGDGEFYTFDSAVDREAFLRKRAKELGVSHEGSEAGKMFEYGNDIASLRGLIQRNNMSPMLQSMFKVIDKAHGAKGISLEKVKDDLIQMWLLTLPERSIRKQFIHSNDVTGMSTDLVRVFNDTASVYANQISKLQYGNRVRQQINAARQAIEPSEKSEYALDPKERNRLESYINILDRRAEEFINPPPRNEMISNANHMAHLYYLSSPSHLLRNMLSIPMRTMPKLNSMYGYGKAFAQAMKYLNVFNSIKFTDEEGGLSPSIRNSRMVRNNPVLAKLFEMGLDRNAMSGQGREIIRHDMASTNKTGRMLRVLYDTTTALFNVSERMSREMAYMMQAELAYDKYIKQGKSQEEALTLAANEAAQGVSSAVGNFSEYERPDFMRTTGKFGDAARSIFMFKMWSLSQAKFFWTYGHKVIKGTGLTKEERIAAMHELGGALAMAVTYAGVFGLPAISAIFSMIDFLEDKLLDDDDPDKKKRRALNPLLADSSEARFRYEWLPKHFGQLTVPGIDGKQHSIAQIIAQGPISGLTGVDVGAKASYNNMFFRSSGYSASYTEAAANFIKNNLGPDVSLGVDFAEAVDNFEKGDVLRGVANLVPSIGKGFISAYRLQTEGAATSKGIPILKKDDLSTLSKLGNAVGFTPTALTDAYNRSSVVRDELLKMETEKSKVKTKFIQAIVKHGDMKAVFEDIKKFNARYPQPQFMLTADQLMSAVGNYQKTYATSIYGTKMPKPEDWIYANWFMKDRYE